MLVQIRSFLHFSLKNHASINSNWLTLELSVCRISTFISKNIITLTTIVATSRTLIDNHAGRIKSYWQHSIFPIKLSFRSNLIIPLPPFQQRIYFARHRLNGFISVCLKLNTTVRHTDHIYIYVVRKMGHILMRTHWNCWNTRPFICSVRNSTVDRNHENHLLSAECSVCNWWVASSHWSRRYQWPKMGMPVAEIIHHSKHVEQAKVLVASFRTIANTYGKSYVRKTKMRVLIK